MNTGLQLYALARCRMWNPDESLGQTRTFLLVDFRYSLPLWTDDTSSGLEVTGDQLREKPKLGRVIRPGGEVRRALAPRAGDSSSNLASRLEFFS